MVGATEYIPLSLEDEEITANDIKPVRHIRQRRCIIIGGLIFISLPLFISLVLMFSYAKQLQSWQKARYIFVL